MAKSKEQIIRENMAYNAEHTTQIKFSFNNRTDADILEHLSTKPNKQGYVKKLIRDDIAKGGNNDSSRCT